MNTGADTVLSLRSEVNRQRDELVMAHAKCEKLEKEMAAHMRDYEKQVRESRRRSTMRGTWLMVGGFVAGVACTLWASG